MFSLLTLAVLTLCLRGVAQTGSILNFSGSGTLGPIINCTNPNFCDPAHLSGFSFSFTGAIDESLTPTACPSGVLAGTSVCYTLPAGALTVGVGNGRPIPTDTTSVLALTLPGGSANDILEVLFNLPDEGENPVTAILDLAPNSFDSGALSHPEPFTPSPQTLTAASSNPPTINGSSLEYCESSCDLDTTTLGLAGTASAFTASPLTITTTSPLPSGDMEASYSQTLMASGGTGGYNWSVSAGTLPVGLSLESGAIFGTPTAAGTSNFTVQVVDSAGDTATAPLTLTINPPPAITTTSPLPGGTVAAYYSQGVTVSGGTAPFYWALTAGALPAGLSLDSGSCPSIPSGGLLRPGPSQGVKGRAWLLNSGARVKPRQTPPPNVCLIDGTVAATASTSTFTIQVVDSYEETVSAQLTLPVNPAPVITTNSPLPAGTVGVPYLQSLVVSGGTPPYVWTVTTGALPPVLALNSANGQIGGTPTTAGTSTFTVQVIDVNGAIATKSFTLTINPPLAITTNSPLPPATEQANYSQTITATGGSGQYTWTVSVGPLPAGLSLNSAGQISGIPTASGNFNFTIEVTDSNQVTATKAFALTINPFPVITTNSPLKAGTVGVAYAQTVVVSGGTSPYIWTIATGTLPLGLTLNSAGQISGTPTTAGTSNFTVQATDVNGATASKLFALTINPVPVITTNSLPPGTVGANYSQTVVATGGTPPLSWAVIAGGLPAGLSLTSGLISGKPITAGSSSFTIQVTDANGATGTKALTLTVNPAPVITTNSLPPGTVGAPYSLTLAVSGGTLPFTWAVTAGTLPSGLTLNSTGQISGTPNTATTSNITVQAKDANGAAASKSFPLTINPAPVITTNSLPPGTVGASYAQPVVVSGGTSPFISTVTAGALPTGLALNSATGQISGTPTTAGSFNFTIKVTDVNAATASKSFTLTVNPAPVITTKSLPAGTVAASYSQIVTATGGTPPLVWAVLSPGALPAGLSLNTGSGQISGTPTTAGTSSFTIQVTDANGATAPASFTLTINPPLAITTASPLPPGTVGGIYSQPLAVSGGTSPYIWTVTAGTLPPGLALNSATGQITGTPTAAGTSNITIQVKDVNGATASKLFALTVNPPPVITTSSPLPTGTVGVSYLQALTATGGSGQYTWTVSVGALPAGLVLNSATGQISGTPTASGPVSFTIQVTDSNQVKATKAFTVTINAALSIITYSPLPPGMVGAIYSVPMIATGGTPPYTWTISGGALPAGLSLNSVQGRIGGTPTTAGAASFSIQVSDSQGLTAAKSFSLSITGVLVITTGSALPAGTVSANYSQTVQATGGAAPYVWALIGGSLPAGLSLNSATGAISGTPTASGHASFTIRITDANQATTTAAFALTVNPPPVITNPPLPNPIVGASYSQTVSVSGGTGPYTFTVTKGVLPPGLSLNSTTGQISGIPTAGGPASFTITVTDSNGVIGSQSFSLTTASLTITTTSPLPGGTAGVSYPALTVLATGGTPPYTWAVSAGALPAGLSLNSTTGKISGTPKAGGVANFTIRVTDANGVIATMPFTLTILSSTTGIPPNLLSPVLGSFYSAQLLPPVPGTPFTWSLSAGSSLPPGLKLSPGGLISGTPVALGSFTVTVQATDASNNTTTITFTLTVTQAPFTLTIQAPPGAPLQQLPITVTLAQAYPVDLSGELVLQFTPNQAAPLVDPAIQFSTGGDTVSFTIPKGQTSAVFKQSPLLVQTGSIAGAIVFTASVSADNIPLTPTTAVTLNLPQEPPAILSVSIQQVTSGFNVMVTGYSNTREITQAAFTFTAQPGSQIQSTSFTPADVGATFQTWYASPASIAYGGQFLYTQPFTITSGTVSALQSVTVTLTNSQGASSSMTATF
jgi:hypothetical protein